MKKIGSPEKEASWNRNLVAQLQFIRRHLRYPASLATALPAIFLAGGISGFVIIFYSVLTRHEFRQHRPWWLVLILALAILVPMLATAYRYGKTLKFVPVRTGAGLSDNMKLLALFLQAHQFQSRNEVSSFDLFPRRIF